MINSATIATTDATFNETNLDNNRAEVTTLLAARTVDLSGRIYVDVEKNNVSDPTDPGIPGASVFLTGTPFTGTTPVNLLTTTKQNGDYVFNNVQQGNYNVQVSTPPGFSFQSSNPGTTQGTPGFQTIANINLNTNSSLNNIGFTRAFSKRLFLASSAPL